MLGPAKVENNAVSQITISMKTEVMRERAKSEFAKTAKNQRRMSKSNGSVGRSSHESNVLRHEPQLLMGLEAIANQSKTDNEKHKNTVGLRKEIPQNIQRDIIDRNCMTVSKLSRKNADFIREVREQDLDLAEGAIEQFKSLRPQINNFRILQTYSLNSLTQEEALDKLHSNKQPSV